ncbi:hypothetical protein ElyMa_002594900 [Elysia marginata]|uniref:Uncharacterized protein n=1 Tax=Elysia marginata TaxID=1093978 RepID=A0AAV4H400_9GAST|nr:hypothetical protein ElyMa_002594900 [Elysia marginata]
MASAADDAVLSKDLNAVDTLTGRRTAAEGMRRQNGEAECTKAEEAAHFQKKADEACAAEVRPTGGAPVENRDVLQAFSFLIGLPVPRILFGQMVEATTATAARKKAWRSLLQKAAGTSETGCIQVDFFDRVASKKNTAFLVLEECGESHDLGAQLDKLLLRMPPRGPNEIRKHLSALIYLGRMVYTQVMSKLRPTLEEIRKKLPAQSGGKPFDLHFLGVDPTNTTLFIDLPKARRVGIYVRLAEETSTAPAEGSVDTVFSSSSAPPECDGTKKNSAAASEARP